MKYLGCALVALVLLLVAACPAEAHANPFGDAGQLVPMGSVGIELELGEGAPAPQREGSLAHDVSIQISPCFFYFFADQLAFGAALDVQYGDYELQSEPYTELTLGASLGFGVHLPLNDVLGFFPRLWLGGGYMRREYQSFMLPPRTFNDPTFQTRPVWSFDGPYASAQLVLAIDYQLGGATFVSFGPHARMQWAFEHGERSWEIGLSAGFGRYF